ncbi:MAG: hypothetical protein HLUCCO18_14905 [Rhodobacteraceae bacterium HLUCCO18]|nr:MAG: hypothetical protein HLUCCO18_14905 [Rhodobacteraceae bacterium HLUCCO18]
MRLTRRHILASVAALGLPGGIVLWRLANRPGLNEAVKAVVHVAFGPDILSETDLDRFARDLEPELLVTFDDAYLRSCRDWVGRLDPGAVRGLDEAALNRARAEAEGPVAPFTGFVASHLVSSTGFAFDPQMRPQVYHGLQAEWPSPNVLTCPPLADFGMDDGWPA